MQEQYLCVHVEEFPVQAMLRMRPSLRETAVAVVEGVAPLEKVCSVNAAARSAGVRRGMTRAELDSCDAVSVLRRSAAEEQAAMRAVTEAAGLFTPRVEVDAEDRRDDVIACAVVLDVTGNERLFGPAGKVAEELVRCLREIGLEARAAVSANRQTAVLLARAEMERVADTVRVVAARAEREALAGLPLAVLRLTGEQRERFGVWGLRTMGELAALDEVQVVQRMGQEGLRLARLAKGTAEHLMVPVETGLVLEEVVEFETPVEAMESLLFVLGPMLDQVIARARSRAYEIASAEVTMSLDGGGEHVRRIRPAVPLGDRALLLKLMHLDLEREPPGAAVTRVRLHAEPGGRSKVQIGLFTPQLPEPSRLELTLARIASVVGEGRVGRAKLRDSHAPESFVVEKFVVPGGRSRVTIRSGGAVSVRRMRPPVPVKVRERGKELSSFYLHGALYEVRERYGPWRRSGHWWSGEMWSREDWDVAADSAGGSSLLCVMTHDLLRDVWHMDALYD